MTFIKDVVKPCRHLYLSFFFSSFVHFVYDFRHVRFENLHSLDMLRNMMQTTLSHDPFLEERHYP